VRERPILLDTCAAIFLASGERLRPEAEQALRRAQEGEADVFLSPITAWELGLLASRGRLVLSSAPDRWFQDFLDRGVVLAEMPPKVLIASSFLPGLALRDPADRILAATAREYRYRLMTRDRPLLDLAKAGHIAAIGC
jgi:PIN domain nuclease of toxin-antitoxin system